MGSFRTRYVEQKRVESYLLKLSQCLTVMYESIFKEKAMLLIRSARTYRAWVKTINQSNEKSLTSVNWSHFYSGRDYWAASSAGSWVNIERGVISRTTIFSMIRFWYQKERGTKTDLTHNCIAFKEKLQYLTPSDGSCWRVWDFPLTGAYLMIFKLWPCLIWKFAIFNIIYDRK